MCNNNCCMCCNCNTNTNNEDTPQEITYTSVCNSDACKNTDCCKCCCGKGLCEDDPKLMVYGLSELMEECCDEVHSALEHIECEIEDLDDKIDAEIERSTDKDNEHDQKNEEQDGRLDTLEYNESLDFNRVVYVTRDESQDHKAYIEFYHNDNYMGRISAEPFLKDGILESVDLLSDGKTLHFVWNTDAGKQDSYVDLDRLVQPIVQDLLTEITNRTNADNIINTNITNLKTSIVGYNPELGYDGTPVTVGQADGKLFRVHMAELPELVQTIENSTNNRIAVTTNKGNTSYVNIVNDTYETIQHAANTYETINHAALTYETKTEAADHLDSVTQNVQNGRILTFSRLSGQNPITITIPDSNTDTLVELNVCTDDAEIPVLLAYGATPTSGTAGEANYSSVTINPHTNVITADLNGNATTATSATNDSNGDNIANTYETIADANNHIKNASFDNSTRKMTFTKQNNTTFDVTIPDANANNYVSNATVSDHTLTLTREGLSDLTVLLPDNNNYVTGATFANNTLTLSRNGGLSDVTCSISIPSTDNDHYPDTMSFNSTTGKLTLSGTNSTFTTLETTIPIPAADNTNPITDVSQSGDTVTFTYKDNTSESITVGGNTNVTYGGSTVTLQQAITSIENRLNALEGLWKKTANNDGLEPVTATHKVYGYGFYDTSVSNPVTP